MPQSFSFRTRLLLSFLIVIVLSLLLPIWYTRHNVSQDLLAEAEKDAANQLALFAELITEHGPFESEAALDEWLTRVVRNADLRLSYVDETGRVLADSDVPFERIDDLDDHSTRPEIRMAHEQEFGTSVRYSATLDKELVYAARRMEPVSGLPAGALRLATPFASLDGREDRLAKGLLAVAGLTFTLAVAISILLTRQMGTEIRRMTRVAEAIGTGNYNRRIRTYPGKEFAPLAKSINDMAESISSQIQTITVQKEQLAAILDNMKEGVMVLGADGRIRAVNRAMSEIIPGIELAQGRMPLEVIMDASLQRACDEALNPEQDGAPSHAALQIEPEKGEVYDVSLATLRERESGLGAVVVFHDISRLKHLERVRRDFVANVSHELRTPLTSIKGYAETLLDDASSSPAIRGFHEIVLKNANHMAKILADLLHLSRLESGRQPMEPTPMDLASAVRTAYNECALLAESRGVRLESDLPAEGLMVLADHDRVVQVLRNLLENAFRYSPEEGVVRVFSETSPDRIVVGVSDQGPGIPLKERSRIFERFYRVEKHRAKHDGSSGLGLAISKHIVEKHGGNIWVESPARNSDAGATFLFSLQPVPGDGDAADHPMPEGHTADDATSWPAPDARESGRRGTGQNASDA